MNSYIYKTARLDWPFVSWHQYKHCSGKQKGYYDFEAEKAYLTGSLNVPWHFQSTLRIRRYFVRGVYCGIRRHVRKETWRPRAKCCTEGHVDPLFQRVDECGAQDGDRAGNPRWGSAQAAPD